MRWELTDDSMQTGSVKGDEGMELNKMDWYHRAAKSFAAEAGEAKDADKLRKMLSKAGSDTEKMLNIYYDIQIDEEWIGRIERAIPHLEAAIREDRQFIKSEGNVTPIERVRKVSRSSVEHLARHSEMITHVPQEGEDLIPDRLNVYENESNFAVYENRVLYMVLCYTRDFVDFRLRRIAEAWGDSSSEISFRKNIRVSGRELSFALNLHDKTLGDGENSAEASCMKRMETIAGSLAVLLSMPLMKEVALSPMVTPPITRTNVLRMDVHFKEVVALYDYLSTYSGDGFRVERHENGSSPFPPEMEQEITELVMYSLYLNYKYGQDAAEELERRYREEEERRKEEYLREQNEKLQKLFGSGDWHAMSDEELAMALEARTQAYEEELRELREKLSALEEMESRAAGAQQREDALQQRIAEQRREMDARLQAVRAETAEKLRAADAQREMLQKVQAELAIEQENSNLLKARLHGMTEQYVGASGNPDLSEKQDFLELEKEREAFERFFERNWKAAKKKVRKRIIWGKGKV